MKKKSSLIRDVLIITLITLVSGALLGLVYNVTKDPIERQRIKKLNEARMSVFSDAADFTGIYEKASDTGAELPSYSHEEDGTVINTVDKALDANGAFLGYVIDVTNSNGYGGDIEIMTGIRFKDGKPVINGISFLSISETAGMGMKAKNADFMGQFNGKEADGGLTLADVDAISGATITTKAVTWAMDAAVKTAAGLYEKEGVA